MLYKRKANGPWWIRISVAGTKIRKSTGTADESLAKEFLAREQQRAWRELKAGDRSATPWREAAARWLKEAAPKKRSIDKDELLLAWFSQYINDEPLSAIDRDAVDKLRDLLLDEKLAPSTVDRYMALLRSILRKARDDWGWISSIPKVPMFHVELREPRHLSPAEFTRLHDELPPHLQLCARFAVLTGLRMRAMLKLTWDRVDLDEKRLWIPGMQMKGKKSHGLPLSAAAVDVLRECREAYPTGDHVFQYPVPPEIADKDVREACRSLSRYGRVPYRRLFEELEARYGARGQTKRVMAIWRAECGERRTGAKHGFHGSIPPVTVTAKVRRLNQPTFRPVDDCNTEAFKKAVARAKVAPLAWHHLRHTFASWASSGGVTTQELMELGAWKSYAMALRYSHLNVERLSRAAEIVSASVQNGHTAKSKKDIKRHKSL